MNKNIYYRPLHENIRVPKCLVIGTTQFQLAEILPNGLHSQLSVKESKHWSLHQSPTNLCIFIGLLCLSYMLHSLRNYNHNTSSLYQTLVDANVAIIN